MSLNRPSPRGAELRNVAACPPSSRPDTLQLTSARKPEAQGNRWATSTARRPGCPHVLDMIRVGGRQGVRKLPHILRRRERDYLRRTKRYHDLVWSGKLINSPSRWVVYVCAVVFFSFTKGFELGEGAYGGRTVSSSIPTNDVLRTDRDIRCTTCFPPVSTHGGHARRDSRGIVTYHSTGTGDIRGDIARIWSC
ncbi:hypothetical protein AB1N83_009724 [Pleurotus pulmonarius]